MWNVELLQTFCGKLMLFGPVVALFSAYTCITISQFDVLRKKADWLGICCDDSVFFSLA